MVQYQKKNFKEAAIWFLKAANQGHENAQYHLGTLFVEGKGVAKSNAKAYFFFSLSADKKFEPAVNAKAALEKQMHKKQREDAMSLYEQYNVKR